MGTPPVLQQPQPAPRISGSHTLENELFATATPPLSPDEAGHLAHSIFGVNGSASLLTGERDLNFLIQASERRKYVMKVTHPSEAPGVTDFQTKAQKHLLRQDPDLPVPCMYPTLAGEHIHWHPIAGTQARQAVRLIGFIDGLPLVKTDTSRSQRKALGAALARFDLAIADFAHAQMDHKLLWDLQHVAELGDLLAFIDDGHKHALARSTLTRVAAQADELRTSSLRRQVIHNDLNAYNVMVADDDPSRITGLLDFGDMVRAPLVQDLAVACAYQLSRGPNPLETALDCITAYHEVHPLTREELSAIPGLVAARLLTTVLITEWRAKQHPANRQYILRNNPLSWDGLQGLADVNASRLQDFVIENVL